MTKIVVDRKTVNFEFRYITIRCFAALLGQPAFIAYVNSYSTSRCNYNLALATRDIINGGSGCAEEALSINSWSPLPIKSQLRTCEGRMTDFAKKIWSSDDKSWVKVHRKNAKMLDSWPIHRF